MRLSPLFVLAALTGGSALAGAALDPTLLASDAANAEADAADLPALMTEIAARDPASAQWTLERALSEVDRLRIMDSDGYAELQSQARLLAEHDPLTRSAIDRVASLRETLVLSTMHDRPYGGQALRVEAARDLVRAQWALMEALGVQEFASASRAGYSLRDEPAPVISSPPPDADQLASARSLVDHYTLGQWPMSTQIETLQGALQLIRYGDQIGLGSSDLSPAATRIVQIKIDQLRAAEQMIAEHTALLD